VRPGGILRMPSFRGTAPSRAMTSENRDPGPLGGFAWGRRPRNGR
jgi:hypothetical protein